MSIGTRLDRLERGAGCRVCADWPETFEMALIEQLVITPAEGQAAQAAVEAAGKDNNQIGPCPACGREPKFLITRLRCLDENGVILSEGPMPNE